LRFLSALGFLTILPVPFLREATAGEVGGSTRYFPLVGLVIGGILAGLGWVFDLALPSEAASALLVAAMVVVTGAMHLDGFADTCDGLVGHRSVEERWAAMRDSRAGAFGIVGVVMLLVVKYAALVSLPVGTLAPALVLAVVTGRWAMTYAVFAYPYARPSGLGKIFKQETRWPGFSLATGDGVVVRHRPVLLRGTRGDAGGPCGSGRRRRVSQGEARRPDRRHVRLHQ
jgi:adenosylcobinamide-GDP ribazoletransferase